MDDLRRSLGPPAGFPNCSVCPYWINGPAHVCVDCAAGAIRPIAPAHCPICSQALTVAGTCTNGLCQGPRWVWRISAIAAYSGGLATAIKALKYDGRWGWAKIFGRLVTGHLEANMVPADVDLIIPNPTFPSGNPDEVSHTEQVLREAHREDIFGRWPFAPDGVLVKTAPTQKSANTTLSAKVAAADALHSVLRLPDPAQVWRKRVIVYDDVCTTGSQLDAVARYLRENGAAKVEGLVLARTQWSR